VIEKLSNGKFRVRVRYGHEERYSYLMRKKNISEREKKEIDQLESKYGKPVVFNTKRSIVVNHYWQAQIIEESFKEAKRLVVEGKNVPNGLIDFSIAPERIDFLEELAYQMSSICAYKEELIDNLDCGLFYSQADVNSDWIDGFDITPHEIKTHAKMFCKSETNFDLKNKRFLFIGSPVGFTSCQDYIYALRRMYKTEKYDGIITVGNWIKTIFLHKSGKNNDVIDAFKALAKESKIYAIRSNIDSAHMVQELKDLGVELIHKIEDEKNKFTGLMPHRRSGSDQLSRWRKTEKTKNLFVHSTYIGVITQSIGHLGTRFIIGSGSSSYHTPSARSWASSYDSQIMDSESHDEIGGWSLQFDNESNVYPSTFHYHEDSKSIFFNGKAYNRMYMKKGTKRITLTDPHILNMNSDGFTAFIKHLEKYRDVITHLYINGDFFVNEILCHHNQGDIREQIKIRMKDLDFIKEVAYTKSALDVIISVLKPSTKIIYKYGNHEINSFGRFLQKEINHFLESFINLDVLLDLSNRGIEVIGGKSVYLVGDIPHFHGHEISLGEAKFMYGVRSVSGHSHGLYKGTDGMKLGTLEDFNKIGYWKSDYSNWTISFGDYTEVDGHVEMPSPVLVSNGKYSDAEGIYKIEERVKVPLIEEFTVNYKIKWTGREGV